MAFPKILHFVLLLFIVFGLNNAADAKSSKKKNKKGQTQLSESINDAMKRSDTDQEKIRIRFDDEATDRIEAWQGRKMDMIEIKHTGTSSITPVDLGDPDYSYEESGVDQSGLDSLHSDIEEESIKYDFDKELRDVSSLKD